MQHNCLLNKHNNRQNYTKIYNSQVLQMQKNRLIISLHHQTWYTHKNNSNRLHKSTCSQRHCSSSREHHRNLSKKQQHTHTYTITDDLQQGAVQKTWKIATSLKQRQLRARDPGESVWALAKLLLQVQNKDHRASPKK